MPAVAGLNPIDPDLYANGDPAANGLPHELYARLRREHPCLWTELADPDLIDAAWVVSRYSDVREVAKNTRQFTVTRGTTTHKFAQSNPKVGKPSLLTMDDRDHKRVRAIVQGAFTPRVIRVFEDQLRERIRRIVDEVLPLRTFDFVDTIARRLPLEAISDLLGVPDAHQQQVLTWTDMLAAPTDPHYTPSPESRFEAAQGLWELALELAELRRTDPVEDIISNLVPQIGTEVLSKGEYQGLFTTIALGGSETTRNNLSHSVHALARDPELFATLKSADADLWTSAVEELTRWSSPVIHFRRTAVSDMWLHGQTIKAGDPVVFLMASANHDPEVFEDPLVLDLDRAPNPHLAFGWGPHFCLGAHLARLETRVVLQEFVSRVSAIELTAPISYSRNATVHGARRLDLRIHTDTTGGRNT